MVIKNNRMRRNLFRSISRSLGRYIAIVAIIALGSSLFVGLRMTKFDMVATGQQYSDAQNMFDIRLASTYGWDRDDVDQVRKLEGFADVEGVFYTDLVVRLGEAGEDSVYRFYSLPGSVNQVALRGGRMPQAPDECLADSFYYDDSILGTQVILAESNDSTALESVRYHTLTVVGYVSSPLYMDMNRGNTSVGSGSLTSFFYLPEEAFDADYYTEIHLTIPGDYAIFTEEYNAAMQREVNRLEPLLEPLGQARYEKVLAEAESAYAEGLAEYEEGLQEFLDGKAQAEQEMADAYQALLNGEKQLEAGQGQINSGRQELYENKQLLAQSKETLSQYESILTNAQLTLYAPLEATKAEIEARMGSTLGSIRQLDNEIAQLDAESGQLQEEYGDGLGRIAELDGKIAALDSQIAGLDARIQGTQAALNAAKLFPGINQELIAQLEGLLAQQNAQRGEYAAQRQELAASREQLASELEEPLARMAELEAKKAELQAQRGLLEQELAAQEGALAEVNAGIAQLDDQLQPIQAQIEESKLQIQEGEKQLFQAEGQLNAAQMQLEESRKELEKGKQEYEEGKARAESEMADAEAKLEEARGALEDARLTIDKMDGPEVFVLDRNSNVGYASLDSNSDIVYSVSKVFPAFFLLIASLVCITTMTRMIEEERTQIGTFKALGYGTGSVINKYLFYAGSGALIGCGLGVTVGSTLFPKILWEAYCIMICIQPNVVLTIDWSLCLMVVGMYTAVILLVTWYCCYRTLQEVPAELIRPKAPAAGKKILLEYLPGWNKLSFLNKVTIRNIFRYRQRLAMMLVGIGGCTALLLTGFGLRDTIVNIAQYQFEEVTVYDMQVYFSAGQSEDAQDIFRQKLAGSAENILFYHQESVDLEVEGQTREIYLMSAGPEIGKFIDFHSGDESVSFPGEGELLLSVGVAEALDVSQGQQVTLRNADMQSVTLTVSGIYDNHVYNYAIVTPETLEKEWGTAPEQQMALVTIRDNADVHEVSAKITGLPGVMNISVSDDLAGMVGSMMDALDLVVGVIVICAGALAVTVLYNLTNININERLREIATIKVLGFNAGETAAYVFKENLALTVMGTILGLPLGRWFLSFVISQIRINMVWFEPRAAVDSYVISAVMTILSALIVDLIFYFKLEKVNMAEALKSVE